MAAVSRLGLYGGPRSPNGSFAGKTEEIIEPSTGGLSHVIDNQVIPRKKSYIISNNVAGTK